ncbi:MAG: phytanoyl-CoA dioxygenase family protein, partial [Bacteroidetes bacterium]|nr:phytanoyl-CoA dioxygenase family protein [Bacteroidota bacterium]
MKHNWVAYLKENHSWLAGSLSRMYAFYSYVGNRRVANRSVSKSAEGVEFVDPITNRKIQFRDVCDHVKSGGIVIGKNIIQKLALTDVVERIFKKGFGISYTELKKIHDLLTPEDIMEKTASLKSDIDLLSLECTILKSLFSNEESVYAELMPNLRPHIPHELLLSKEKIIEKHIGRGKMNAHGPHKDSWRYHPKNTVNVWLALTDVNHLNGMFLLPN